MDGKFSRTEKMIGSNAMSNLAGAKVLVFGLGGVGSYTIEALVRSGIGELCLVDADTVAISNINRQLIATAKTVGMAKTDAAKERALEINPDIKIETRKIFVDESTIDGFDFKKYDYIVDAIDTVKSKILIIKKARDLGVKIISSMGAGNKLDPTKFEVADIKKTSVCPLAKVVRKELKNLGINSLKVVFSTELPVTKQAASDPTGITDNFESPLASENLPYENSMVVKTNPPASIAFVPSVVGLIIAGEVIKDIAGINLQ